MCVGSTPPAKQSERQSNLIARIEDAKLELPPLKSHQHCPEFVPGKSAAIDQHLWLAPFCRFIPLDTAAHNRVDNVVTTSVVGNVFDGERALNLLNQASQQVKQLFFRVTYHLELVARRSASDQFKPFKRQDVPQQAGAKMKFMRRPIAIDNPHRFEPDVFKLVQANAHGHFGIETGGAQVAIRIPARTKVDNIVARRDGAACLAKGLAHFSRPINAWLAQSRLRRSTS